MKQSNINIKTKKENPADETSINAILLDRAGFVHKEMAGVYTFLPLGLRTLNKIENIVRRHMDTIGSEVLMSSLSPFSKWEDTGRKDSVDVLMKTIGANELSKKKSENEYILNSTHEEIITPIASENIRSYKDLPASYYQIQTKFRNEARAKSGILRGREFRMKDLYSFHTSPEDLQKFYDNAKIVYANVFKDLGIGADTFITLASGGDFTTDFSHEFQTLLPVGEDEIYLDRINKIAYNKEVVNDENAKKLGVDFSKMEVVTASEVGNIFPLNTKFSKAINFEYVDVDNQKKPVYMGSYGIGPSRVMGVITEKYADDKGLVWPKNISPFNIHLISLHKNKDSETYKKAESLYNIFKQNDFEVLFDDRDVGVGEKLNDADIFGITLQVIVGDKGLEKNIIEIKNRKTGEKNEVEISDDKSIVEKVKEIWEKAL